MRCFNTQPPEGGWYGTPRLISGNLLFQHTAARRRLAYMNTMPKMHTCFNTQPPEGGWVVKVQTVVEVQGFNTQPPEGGWLVSVCVIFGIIVFQHTAARRRLGQYIVMRFFVRCFNTQPPEGGWVRCHPFQGRDTVSTHSRPKAAGHRTLCIQSHVLVSTHSRPKAAGRDGRRHRISRHVSTHSRPKAAGF